MHYPTNWREKLTTMSCLVILNQSELTASLMTFLVANGSIFQNKMNFSSLSSTDHGEKDLTTWWMLRMILVQSKTVNRLRHQPSTQITTELKAKRQWAQRRKWRTARQLNKQQRNTHFPTDKKKWPRQSKMAITLVPENIILRKERTFPNNWPTENLLWFTCLYLNLYLNSTFYKKVQKI